MAKTKLNNALIEKAKKYVSAGHFTVIVCQYLGICEATYYSWINRANEDIENNRKTIYVKFLKSIKEAEAEAEIRNLQIIQNAARKSWAAAAWYLERKFRDRWGYNIKEIEFKQKIDEEKLKHSKQVHEDKMAIEIEKLERGVGTENDTPTTIVFTDEDD